MTTPLSEQEISQFIGARLKRARTTRGMGQAELGEHIGVSYQQIQKYERGSNRIMAVQLVRAASVLGRPVTDFLPADLLTGPKDMAAERALASPLGVRLLQAFLAIEGGKAREAAVTVVEAIAQAETARD